jgi:hypothetical protein
LAELPFRVSSGVATDRKTPLPFDRRMHCTEALLMIK